jgi:hypothetical protein
MTTPAANHSWRKYPRKPFKVLLPKYSAPPICDFSRPLPIDTAFEMMQEEFEAGGRVDPVEDIFPEEVEE